MPCTIYKDNQGSIALPRHPTSHVRTKHNDIRHHFIRKAIANQHVDLEYCPTKDMAADLLTKPLPSPSLQSCVRSWAWESSLLSEWECWGLYLCL
ncbi:hypothetical protein PhCBS80983_g06429 [Powellomyces hirtus]|uniref:Uncharacterized protein n=1 Tax=Powellomyces hirtus TaxID=109895 RepID=A0A507DNV3_9FUNG|nr:hypothetical protein PhCBS80983_g06429 [Powellomyces hirtus]